MLIESFNKELAKLVDETNGRGSSVHLKYVGPNAGSYYRRNQADDDTQTQRRPRERFDTVISEFLEDCSTKTNGSENIQYGDAPCGEKVLGDDDARIIVQSVNI
ncbi:hypothetical protein RvY_11121 [Ramazzottius varieornatus]|uniref:Uncharacterized protein n=1 Tax=Ramazzottius varieornatus TaxID=947166 RepID=A0A1D1VNY8_RAMVA|nr:hypothetical protein RvY_11121 [Ramazzottius varieornatus]